MAVLRPITAKDLYDFELIQDLAISPDGQLAAYVLQRVDPSTEKKYTNIWIAPLTGGKPRQFTIGDQADTSPKFSPDGKNIAFLSNRDDEKQMQFYLIAVDGGEARPLTKLKGSIGDFEWSPDGKQLVMEFRKKDAEAIAREKDEKKRKLGTVDRQVQRLFYKMDGAGYLPKEQWHIWTVNARTGRAKQLTDGKVLSEWGPVWSPDSNKIAFLSNRQPEPDLEPDKTDIYWIPASGGEMTKLPTPVGDKGSLSFSPDGSQLAYLGKEGESDWWKNQHLWVLPFDGSAPARDLTAAFDFEVACDVINDLIGAAHTMPPVWSADGKRMTFQVSQHGRCGLFSLDIQGEDLQPLIDQPGVVGAFAFDQTQQNLVYFFGNMRDPGQLYHHQMENGQSRSLTKINKRLLNRLDLGKVEEVWFDGADGNPLQGWILKPPGFNPRKKYPSIMEIHGGPLTQYGEYFMHEFYYLAAQGYVVYFCNPRGGRGYGESHAKAIWGDWGGVDYADLMVWADYMQQKAYIDSKRMGVTGGSYGGYMTSWIIGHTQRFKAAAAQRVVSNFLSMWGSSDFNWIFQQPIGADAPWQDFEKYWAQSPMKYMGNAKTPTLLIHSEQDNRCPIEQGEQVFVALKTQGVPTEMIRFPGEPHGLSRIGRTDRRIARLEHIKRWFETYLKK